MTTNGHPRRLHMDRASGLFSNEIKSFRKKKHNILQTAGLRLSGNRYSERTIIFSNN